MIKKPFDKYEYYIRAVQAPDVDVEFIRDTYRELRRRNATILREDFCGTFVICKEWIKLAAQNEAIGIDLDREPIEWGMKNTMPELTQQQRNRLRVLQENVLNPALPQADVICAMNFSHYIFKRREELRAYFHNCKVTLAEDGILLTDCFGGSACQEANEESTNHGDFVYYWEQKSFEPITNEAKFWINFKRRGEEKRNKVFSYDWRMWSIPEIREIMLEAGFKKTWVYWEGTNRDGTGNGVFKRTEVGEECQAWVAYVVGEK